MPFIGRINPNMPNDQLEELEEFLYEMSDKIIKRNREEDQWHKEYYLGKISGLSKALAKIAEMRENKNV